MDNTPPVGCPLFPFTKARTMSNTIQYTTKSLRRSESAYSSQPSHGQQQVRFYGECTVIPAPPSALAAALRSGSLPSIGTKSVTVSLPFTWGHCAIMQLDHQDPSLPSGSRTCLKLKLPR